MKRQRAALRNSMGFVRPSTQSKNSLKMLIAALTSRFHNIRVQAVLRHSRALSLLGPRSLRPLSADRPHVGTFTYNTLYALATYMLKAMLYCFWKSCAVYLTLACTYYSAPQY